MIPESIQKITFLFIFLFSFFLGMSQEKELDSLFDLLKANQKQDSLRVDLLLGIVEKTKHSGPESAFPYVDEAIDISNKQQLQRRLALSYTEKGNLYYIVADNLRALEFYQKAMAVSEKINFKSQELSLLNNLANIHADLKEYDKALEKYETFLSTSEDLDNVPNQIRGLTNIAVVYTDSNRYEEGVAYLQKALGLAKEEENEFFIAAITNNLALAYKGMGAYQKSLESYQEAVEMAKKIENIYIEASALNSIGKVNILLENYEMAGQSGRQALELSEKMGAIEWQADSWKVLSTVYENQGKTMDALSAYKNHIKFRDSVTNEENKSEITRKEMQFKMEKQEALANVEIERQQLIKNGYLAGAVLLAFSTLIAYVFYKRRRDAIEKKKVADFNTKVAETELKALRSQMNPHFIFNSLNSISDYMVKNDMETANDYLTKFAKLTRSILENSEKKWIALEEDLELTRMYIEIEALRLKNKLSHSISVDDALDIENTLVPPMLMQPFIENSIWHGIDKKNDSGHIDIHVKMENEMIVCVVDDDGVGRKKMLNGNVGKNSMGIKITESRLEIIGRLKKIKGSIEMFDKEQGLRVELKLPLELRF